MVTRQQQVKRRTGKVHRTKTDILPKIWLGVKFWKTGHVTLTMPIRVYTVIVKLALDIFYLQTKFGPNHTLSGVVCHPQAGIWYSLCIKFDDSSVCNSRDITEGLQNIKWVTWPCPRSFVIHLLGHDIAYLCTKFDHSSFRYMVGAHQNLNGSRDLTTPLSGMVCHPHTSTCYNQPIYQI